VQAGTIGLIQEGKAMAKSEDARVLDNAIRAANTRATEAFAAGDDGAYADASTDLAALRDMRLALGETG
jgi:hypothetical protein